MRNRAGSERIIALIIMFVVVVIFVAIIIPNNSTAIMKKIPIPDYLYTNPETGSSIGFFDPLKYKDNITKAIYQIPQNSLTTENLPPTFTRQAEVAQMNTTQPIVVANGELTTLQVNTNLVSKLNMTATAATGSPVLSTVSNPSGIYHTGDVIPITGKIVKTGAPPPYHYNILLTCCGLNSYFAQDNILTEGDGTFYYPIHTSSSFPLGSWTATVDTLDVNSKDFSYKWSFTLLP